MHVMTSQYETSGKIHVYSSKEQNPEYNILTRENNNIGTSSILARGKRRVLPTSALFTLCQMVRAFWQDHSSFGAFSKCLLNYNICALLYSNQGYTQYQRQVNIFLSLVFPGSTISVLSNRLQRCARTPHVSAITS